MNPITMEMDQTEEEVLSLEVSDEVLESAAAIEMTPPYTIALCTWVLIYPSWAGN